jgi:hypothetical protein
MFALRLRMFIDWHSLAGHQISIARPGSLDVAQDLADLGIAHGLDPETLALPAPRVDWENRVLPITNFRDHTTIEDVARDVIRLLERQTDPFGSWGDATFMAITELCDNALQHGVSEIGAYVAADRMLHPRRQFRLAIADLGIGIPEHVRARHPEWHDDSAAIARALERGVSGTGDRHRGNGFAEVFDAAARTDLVRASSAVDVDLRAGKGRVGVVIAGGNPVSDTRQVDQPRRGTWITYTVTSA